MTVAEKNLLLAMAQSLQVILDRVKNMGQADPPQLAWLDRAISDLAAEHNRKGRK